MKTINARKTRESEIDEDPIEDAFDDLVWEACKGDSEAVGLIATTVGTILLEEAESALGDFEREAGEVLHDLFAGMLERRLRFAPARGRALPWLCAITLAIARQRRRERERDWGMEEDYE